MNDILLHLYIDAIVSGRTPDDNAGGSKSAESPKTSACQQNHLGKIPFRIGNRRPFCRLIIFTYSTFQGELAIIQFHRINSFELIILLKRSLLSRLF